MSNESRERAIHILQRKWMLNNSNRKVAKVDCSFLLLITTNKLSDITAQYSPGPSNLILVHRHKTYKWEFDQMLSPADIRKLFANNTTLLVSCRISKAYGNYAIVRIPEHLPRNAHELERLS